MNFSAIVRLEERGRIAVVTLNRPERLNAFNDDMLLNLQTVTNTLKKSPPWVVILTGSGDKAFSAGFDVNPDNPMVADFLLSAEKHDRGPAAEAMGRLRGIVDDFVSLPVPIIAALNGVAFGGGAEIAVRCDLRIMDPRAVVCFSEVRLGLMPDWGGGATLSRLIGPSRAADLILTAREIGAEEALALGMVNRISRPGTVLEEALVLAEAIASNGPRAVRHALTVIRRSRDLSLRDNLALELSLAADLIASGECIHGVSAFLMKKKPDFPDIVP
ncbi:MAG: enoyl-CoA hydratase/isomerase family protein [Thermodesulfobacteriota bacterium]